MHDSSGLRALLLGVSNVRYWNGSGPQRRHLRPAVTPADLEAGRVEQAALTGLLAQQAKASWLDFKRDCNRDDAQALVGLVKDAAWECGSGLTRARTSPLGLALAPRACA